MGHFHIPLLAFATFLVPAGGFAAPEAPPPEYRRAIPVSGEAAVRLRLEMRQYLIGVKKIVDAAGANDMKRVAEAAREINRAAEHPMPEGFHAALPDPFLQLAVATQAGFAEMAVQAENGGDGRTALVHLGRVMSHCVSCHVTYRLEVMEDASEETPGGPPGESAPSRPERFGA